MSKAKRIAASKATSTQTTTTVPKPTSECPCGACVGAAVHAAKLEQWYTLELLLGDRLAATLTATVRATLADTFAAFKGIV